MFKFLLTEFVLKLVMELCWVRWFLSHFRLGFGVYVIVNFLQMLKSIVMEEWTKKCECEATDASEHRPLPGLMSSNGIKCVEKQILTICTVMLRSIRGLAFTLLGPFFHHDAL